MVAMTPCSVMEISRNEDTVTRQVFCAPSLARVADDRGVKKVLRYYGANCRVFFLPRLSVAAESTVSVR
jgi:hypothetical protein